MPAADIGAALLIEAATGIGPEELYPPAQYSGWWLLLALGIILVLILVVVLIVALTRPPKQAPAPAAPVPHGTPVEQLEHLRADYLHRIDLVEQAHAAGTLDARGVNAELSAITRRFVNEYTGVATPVMSLEELEHQDVHPALLEALNRYYYPSIFGDSPPTDPGPGIAAAREVVTAWH
ncbi:MULTISPECIES: hypothetical protein [unclassified Microbacterium]|uniref:hypothetical protein n=1 Tax=unclassified Microbacterium TaxID=2609290 RepID=UPI00097E7B8B|nr:hypothetical protein [Microbacterium sp. JB110]RCS60741.1 hypothetical protein CIK77_08680 [Microbacterium sp. JB110]SJM43862.1 hypothetical protein CZ774_00300 [Frigoribacterium sp. JB110]